MPRKKRSGLNWFPLDVDFFTDRRIRRIIGRQGPEAALLYIYILCAAYKNSYFIPYSRDLLDEAALDLNIEARQAERCLKLLLEKELLDPEMFESRGVLTSRAIQQQYQESIQLLRHLPRLSLEHWLLSPGETLRCIKQAAQDGEETEDNCTATPDNCAASPDNCRHDPGKEMKGKEKKENEMKGEESPAAPPPSKKILDELISYCRKQNYDFDPIKFYERYAPQGLFDPGSDPSHWQSIAYRWQHTQFKTPSPSITTAANYRPQPEIDMAALQNALKNI